MSVIDFASDPPVIWDIFGSVVGRRAFDIGANGGIVARLLAENFEEVHAFEPASESYDHLSSGLPDHVWAHKVAVSDHDGEVTLDERTVTGTMGELTTGATMVRSWGKQTGTRSVPCVTIDAMAAKYGAPDFIKVDVEGHERAVLAGGLETIKAASPRLLIEVHDREHGVWIMDNVPGPFRQVRHPAYPPQSAFFHDHYFLLRGL